MDQDQFAAIAAMFKVIVPWCLGWFTFYLLTKQANPFKKPEALAKRPKWFLSLGLGLLIGATFSSPTIGIENDFLGMAIVKTTFLAIFMIPVFFGYIFYKRNVRRATNRDPFVSNFLSSMEQNSISDDDDMSGELPSQSGRSQISTLSSAEEAAAFGLDEEEIEYLGYPIKAVRYLERYEVSEETLSKAIRLGKIRCVLCRGVLWVQNQKIT